MMRHVLFADFQIENRGDVALYLRGKIIFTNESELQLNIPMNVQ